MAAAQLELMIIMFHHYIYQHFTKGFPEVVTCVYIKQVGRNTVKIREVSGQAISPNKLGVSSLVVSHSYLALCDHNPDVAKISLPKWFSQTDRHMLLLSVEKQPGTLLIGNVAIMGNSII